MNKYLTAAILCVVKKCIGKTKETRETSLNNLKSNQILGAHNINFFVDSLFGWFHSSQSFFSGFSCYMILNSEIMLTACDDGEPSATESTRRKAFSFDAISKMQRLSLRG